MPSILVIQPDEIGPPELLGHWLSEQGFELRVIRPYAGDPVPRELVEDALIVLGGDMGANDDEDHPWLGDIKALMRATVAAEAPTLGICLGGQLLAAALGGRVEPGDAGMESGTVVLRNRASVESDEFFGQLAEELRMMTMHRDAITQLPDGAVWLADSDPYPHQAFRVGSSAWGVQFHPEVSVEGYRYWAEVSTDEGDALQRVIDGIPEAERHAEDIESHAMAFAEAFASVVRNRRQSTAGENGEYTESNGAT